ncbi:rRNA methylase, putative, group 3 [Caldibacillus debilis GB1]|uniref:rRNA methylase, putative, group 3 n=1 Tax=Caldibacillus debilis GB1 TaxID=1339248 RepID=A0A420VIJ0_9BACI|nr:rRNA methylase, putative, group 3 [Caldibacillus debilis GB1]
MGEWIIGKNPVLESLKGRREIHKIWVAEGSQKSARPVIRLAKENNVPVQIVPKNKLDEMTEGNHQGIVAQAAAYRYYEPDDLLEEAKKRGELPFLLLLDEIEDPRNLGSIMRTADAAGVHGVIIPKRRSAGLTETVAKASAGAIEYVRVARVTNLARTIDQLKEKGIWIAGMDAEGETDYRLFDGKMPVALVIGNEGRGLGRLIKEKCDFLLRLPMAGHVSSLNASVAAGIMMYEIFRKRSPGVAEDGMAHR